MKKNKRITTRKFHKVVSFMGFVYLGSLINNLKIKNKKYFYKRIYYKKESCKII